MKKIIFWTLALLLCINVSGQDVTKPNSKTKLLVYYFHITNRCNTCKSIEAAVKKTLETNFKNELAKGTIIFQTFNVDLPENKKLVDKYQAYGATLALTPIVKGKEAGIDDLTNFAFSKIHEEENFSKELKDKINSYIK